ncbi:nuclear receptor-binding factor 2-like isoform X3 [Tachypleus tridentatus]|uniref:nuclear receptor-binding factor 2-like isoform X3 n=1 Tax=Tachypleus tridentatus TaxID=6853 RepID=UPI003FCFC5B6
METSLDFAHQQYRIAEGFLKSGKFEEAILCHQRAAGGLKADKFRESQRISHSAV